MVRSSFAKQALPGEVAEFSPGIVAVHADMPAKILR